MSTLQTRPPADGAATGSADTAAYYDKNTALFIRTQKALAADTIHRALYAPGVRNRQQALQYCHTLILEEMGREDTRRVLDLGCGVGATIRFLRARRPDVEYRGLTVSAVQRNIAAQEGLPVELGDYHQEEWFREQRPFDLVYAVESLQHARDLDTVLANVAHACPTAGRLLVIDDFQSDVALSGRYQRLQDRFRRGWHAHGYRRRDEFIRAAEAAGFGLQRDQDLSAYMRSRRIFNLFLYLLLSPLGQLKKTPAFAENLLGGNALLRLQDLGLSTYRLMVFEKTL